MYLVTQSCLTLCNPMNSSPSGSSVHGIFRQEYWSGLSFPSPKHCYKYFLLGIGNECLVAKYHTQILYKKKNIYIYIYIWTFLIFSWNCIGAYVPSLLVHLPHHLLYGKRNVKRRFILDRVASCNPKLKQKVPYQNVHYILLATGGEFES